MNAVTDELVVGMRVYRRGSPGKFGVIKEIKPAPKIRNMRTGEMVDAHDVHCLVVWHKNHEEQWQSSWHLASLDQLIADTQKKLQTHQTNAAKLDALVSQVTA